MWKSKPSGKCCPSCIFTVFTSNGGIEFDWSGRTWEIALLIQTDWRVRTACPRIPWSPLGPLEPNSAVMASLGDLMSPQATCVRLGGRRGRVPQLQPLSGGSGRRQQALRHPPLPRHSHRLPCLPKWHWSSLMTASALRSRRISEAIYSHLLR